MSVRSSVERGAMVAFVTGAFVFSGCSSGKESTNDQPTDTTNNTVDLSEIPSVGHEFSPQVIELYPEVSNLIPTSYRVSTLSGKETNIYDLAGLDINTGVVRGIYDYIEKYLGEQSGFSLKLDQTTYIGVLPHPIIKRRNTLFLSDSAPLPSWSNNAYGKTKYPPESDYSVTFLRIGGENLVQGKVLTEQESFSLLFATEACQQSLLVFVFGDQGNISQDLAETLAAQELVCNSIGHAIFRRIVGDTYEQYVDWVNSTGPINLPNLEGFGLSILDRERYEEIPNTPILE